MTHIFLLFYNDMIPEDVKINPAKKEKRRKVVTENMIRAGIFFQPNAVSQLLSVTLAF